MVNKNRLAHQSPPNDDEKRLCDEIAWHLKQLQPIVDRIPDGKFKELGITHAQMAGKCLMAGVFGEGDQIYPHAKEPQPKKEEKEEDFF